jgi:hypothetical protein
MSGSLSPCPSALGVMEQPATISFWRRMWLWLAAWGVAATAAVLPHPIDLMYAFPARYIILSLVTFPYGIMALLVTALGLRGQDAPHVLVAWAAYLLLTVWGLATTRRTVYFAIYSVLCLLLGLNVIGCHMMFHGYPKQ